jgi:hypothetical protein
MRSSSACGSVSTPPFTSANSASTCSRIFLDAGLVDEDLDARLVLVVAAAIEVVDAQDRLEIGEQVLLRQEVLDLLGRSSACGPAAADIDRRSRSRRPVILRRLQADVVEPDRGAVIGAPVIAILNLRGRYENSGCSDDHCRRISAYRPRIGDLVGGGAGELVRRDVADAVARGLDGVHLDLGEVGQDVRHVLQRGQLNWMFWRVVKWP